MSNCAKVGLFEVALGDVDQSICGLKRARPDLLSSLSEREGAETVRLTLNYSSDNRLVVASRVALGER